MNKGARKIQKQTNRFFFCRVCVCAVRRVRETFSFLLTSPARALAPGPRGARAGPARLKIAHLTDMRTCYRIHNTIKRLHGRRQQKTRAVYNILDAPGRIPVALGCKHAPAAAHMRLHRSAMWLCQAAHTLGTARTRQARRTAHPAHAFDLTSSPREVGARTPSRRLEQLPIVT